MQRQNIGISFRPNGLLFQIVVGCSLGLILSIVCIWLSPLLVFGTLAAAALLIYAVLKRPEICLLGYLIITSTIMDASRFPEIPIGIGRLVITDVILLALLGIIIIRLLLDSNYRISHSPLNLPLLAFLGIGMLATILAIGQSSLTVRESLGEVRRVLGYLTFFIVINLVREERQLRTLLRGLLFLATVVAFGMVAQFLLGRYVQILPGRVETLGTEGVVFMGVTRIIPPGYSLVFVAFILLTAIFLLETFRGIRVVDVLQWILLGIGILLTYKRHLWGMIAFAVLIMLFIINPQKRIKLFYISQALLILFVTITLLFTISDPGPKVTGLMNGVLNRVGSLFQRSTYSNSKSSLRWRDFEYQYAIPQIVAHPLLGLGLGAAYRPLVRDRDREGFDGRTFIHNGHIAIMTKTGLLGYLCYLWFAVVFLYRGFRNWRSVPDPLLRKIVIGCMLSFLGLFLGSMVEAMVVDGNCTALIGILIGISEVILLYHGKQQVIKEKSTS